MNGIGNFGDDSRFLSRLPSVAVALVLGCTGHVDLGGAAQASPPDPVTNDRELAAQTSNLLRLNAQSMSRLAIDADFLYFISIGSSVSVGPDSHALWRCRKSDCWATLIAIAHTPAEDFLRLEAGRFEWYERELGVVLCDAPDCSSQIPNQKFETWDDRFGYWFDSDDSSIYRGDLLGHGTGKALVASQPMLGQLEALPRDYILAGDQLYWLDAVEGIMRASADGSTKAERLTLGSVTSWTTSRLGQPFASDVTVIDMALDGAYIYAALRVGNQNANQTLECDSCTAGIAVARWQHSAVGAAREWVLMNDADVAELVHLTAFGGEVIWGTGTGNLWSCLADQCATSKRQIGIEDASSKISSPGAPFDSVAVDEQSIFWLSVPCQPATFDCSPSGSRDWTLKRTPRIPQ